ncbi:hypothetical protein JB92DRAFT_3099213 [Gautieria morchelliformis]|nr:hypothetical protein JB92DRAFT_3099213 [Gautieria morchelliformis]
MPSQREQKPGKLQDPKRYTCEHVGCLKDFTRKAGLRKHQLSHTGLSVSTGTLNSKEQIVFLTTIYQTGTTSPLPGSYSFPRAGDDIPDQTAPRYTPSLNASDSAWNTSSLGDSMLNSASSRTTHVEWHFGVLTRPIITTWMVKHQTSPGFINTGNTCFLNVPNSGEQKLFARQNLVVMMGRL